MQRPPYLKPVPAIMYIDESGRAHPSFQEVNAVGALAIPATRNDLDAVTGFVGDVFERRYGDRSVRGPEHKFQIETLTDDERNRLADLIRRRVWYLGYSSLPPNTKEDDIIWDEIWSEIKESTIEAFERASNHADNPQRAAQIVNSIEAMKCAHPLWTWLVFMAINDIASLFRKNGLFPKMKVLVDEHGGHTAEHLEFLRFLTRFSFTTKYPELYSKRLSATLGLIYDDQFKCRASSDSKDDGIHIANLIANAARKLRRGRDKHGRIQAFFDRCSVTWNERS